MPTYRLSRCACCDEAGSPADGGGAGSPGPPPAGPIDTICCPDDPSPSVIDAAVTFGVAGDPHPGGPTAIRMYYYGNLGLGPQWGNDVPFDWFGGPDATYPYSFLTPVANYPAGPDNPAGYVRYYRVASLWCNAVSGTLFQSWQASLVDYFWDASLNRWSADFFFPHLLRTWPPGPGNIHVDDPGHEDIVCNPFWIRAHEGANGCEVIFEAG